MGNEPSLTKGDALIIVDVQRDFLPGGSLPVPHGDEIIPILNRWLEAFHRAGLPVFATRDWHPADHCSFQERGGRWPVHCVADSPGARFAEGLRLPLSAQIVSKATQPDKEAYSGFDGTDLAARLRALRVKRLFVGGLATDYCVLNTVKDALARHFEVLLLEDAVRPVELRSGDGEWAKSVMRRLGARLIRWQTAAA